MKLAGRRPVVLMANNESSGVACGVGLARRSLYANRLGGRATFHGYCSEEQDH